MRSLVSVYVDKSTRSLLAIWQVYSEMVELPRGQPGHRLSLACSPGLGPEDRSELHCLIHSTQRREESKARGRRQDDRRSEAVSQVVTGQGCGSLIDAFVGFEQLRIRSFRAAASRLLAFFLIIIYSFAPGTVLPWLQETSRRAPTRMQQVRRRQVGVLLWEEVICICLNVGYRNEQKGCQ